MLMLRFFGDLEKVGKSERKYREYSLKNIDFIGFS